MYPKNLRGAERMRMAVGLENLAFFKYLKQLFVLQSRAIIIKLNSKNNNKDVYTTVQKFEVT
jgi:hypothetical protein